MLSSIRLQNFRSYKDASFEFAPGVNIVVGPNASGKTNLLESVLVVARGGSYRARDIELVAFNKSWSRLEAYFDHSDRVAKLTVKGGRTDKNFIIDGKHYKRLSQERVLPAVVFEPDHLQLITRGPEQRREFFDELLERTQAEFKLRSASYRRALAQRNALLKRGPTQAKQQLFAWNIRLSELGGQIALARYQLLAAINKNISHTYTSIAGKKSRVKVEYASHFPADRYGSRMLSKLEASMAKDLERGFTAYGPHREDFIFYLNGRPVIEAASRGEIRSLVLALKVFELDLVEQIHASPAIFLLDDVFSELDGARRHSLVNYLSNRQILITTTDAEAVLEYFALGKQNLISLAE